MTSTSAGSSAPRRARRRRFTPLALVTGLVSAVILALSMNSSLAAFTAQITNSINTLTTGTLTMLETGPGNTPVTCSSTSGTDNAFTCATINKYGGTATPLAPGGSVVTTITIKNTGTVPANTFTLQPGTCTQTPAGNGTTVANDFCTQAKISIGVGTPAPGTAITAANASLTSIAGTTFNLATPVAPNAVVTFTFTVSLPTGLNNTYQGLQASQPLVFTFTS